MSHFRCPLCGKQSSVKNYFPGDFEEGITVVEVRGLGRGRGFETVGEYSIESFPDLLGKIKNRVIEINASLGIDTQQTVTNLQKENQNLGTRLNQEYRKRISLEDELEELDISYYVNRISQYMNVRFGSLDKAVDYLIRTYSKINIDYNDLLKQYNIVSNEHDELQKEYNKVSRDYGLILDEYVEVLDYINGILPEEHPEYDSVEKGVEALIQVYEDELEELEDSL